MATVSPREHLATNNEGLTGVFCCLLDGSILKPLNDAAITGSCHENNLAVDQNVQLS